MASRDANTSPIFDHAVMNTRNLASKVFCSAYLQKGPEGQVHLADPSNHMRAQATPANQGVSFYRCGLPGFFLASFRRNSHHNFFQVPQATLSHNPAANLHVQLYTQQGSSPTEGKKDAGCMTNYLFHGRKQASEKSPKPDFMRSSRQARPLSAEKHARVNSLSINPGACVERG